MRPLLAPALALCLTAAACQPHTSGPVPVLGEAPQALCLGQENRLRLVGEGFAPVVGATAGPGAVQFPTVTLTRVTDLDGAPVPPQAVVLSGTGDGPNPGRIAWAASDTLILDVAPPLQGLGGPLAHGRYQVEVENPGGAQTVAAGTVEVRPAPVLFFLDPPVIYNFAHAGGAAVTVPATAYVAGLAGPVTALSLVRPDGSSLALAITAGSPSQDRLSVAIPTEDPGSGAPLAPGTWRLEVEAGSGCMDALPGALRVTDDHRLEPLSVEPASVSTTRDTAVTVTGDGFEPIPRAWLTPTGGDGALWPLRAAVRPDGQTLHAVVPAGLAPGWYDLVVVNPVSTAGDPVPAAGFASAVVYVSGAEPPVITGVVPASVDMNGSALPVVLRGRHLGGAEAGGPRVPPAVWLTCREPDGTLHATVPGDGVVEVLAATATEVNLSVSPAALGAAAGTLCVVGVENPDGARFEFSALALRQPAANLAPFALTSRLRVPRQGLALVAGRPTERARYLYALGGDPGDPAAPLDSVERVALDPFGGLAGQAEAGCDPAAAPGCDRWSLEPHPLPVPLTLAGAAQVGRFLYLAGGWDGTAASDGVFRAEVMDPLVAPAGVSLAFDLGAAPGLAPGFWIYRITALWGPDDATNPGGETLPGEPVVVQVPDHPGTRLTLTWAPVPGAVGYRVYRTPTADARVDTVAFLAEVAEPLWEDGGDRTPDGGAPPPAGSLGRWHRVATLPRPTVGAAVAAVADPAVPDRWQLHVVGGADGLPFQSATPLDEDQVLILDRVATFAPGTRERQTVLDTVTVPGVLSVPRALLGAWTVTDEDLAVLEPSTPWLYFGPGKDAQGDVGTLEARPVASDPAAPATRVVGTQNGRTGAGLGDANGFLFLFGGGAGGSAGANGRSFEICTDASVPQCSEGPPTLRNPTNSAALEVARSLMGATQESAFFFLAGGCTSGCTGAAPQPTDTVEWTVR